MGKVRTFGRRGAFSRSTQRKRLPPAIKSGMGVDTYDPTGALLDEDRIGRAIWECLKEGDAEGVVEIIQIHLQAVNKARQLGRFIFPKARRALASEAGLQPSRHLPNWCMPVVTAQTPPST